MLETLNKYKVYALLFIISVMPFELPYRLLAYLILWTLYGTYCIGLTLKYKQYLAQTEQKKKPSAATEGSRVKTLKK